MPPTKVQKLIRNPKDNNKICHCHCRCRGHHKKIGQVIEKAYESHSHMSDQKHRQQLRLGKKDNTLILKVKQLQCNSYMQYNTHTPMIHVMLNLLITQVPLNVRLSLKYIQTLLSVSFPHSPHAQPPIKNENIASSLQL